MADRHRDDVAFVFVYTREAHPGEKTPAHASMSDKLRRAREMVQRFDIRRPMLVDDLDGTLHRAYGSLPNMSYLVATGGTVTYRANWTDARTVEMAVEQLLHERAARRDRARLAPYYMEMQPQRINERAPFMEALLELAGVRAVDEFIAAIGHSYGDAAAGPLRRWWSDRSSAG